MPDPAWTADPDPWAKRFQAWGSMGVTFAILILLAYVLVITSRATDTQAFNGLIEVVKAMAMIVVGFWLGSSNSGQRKDDVIASTITSPPPSTTTVDARSGTAVVSTGASAPPPTEGKT